MFKNLSVQIKHKFPLSKSLLNGSIENEREFKTNRNYFEIYLLAIPLSSCGSISGQMMIMVMSNESNCYNNKDIISVTLNDLEAISLI